MDEKEVMNCRTTKQPCASDDFQGVVQAYITQHRDDARRELRFYAIQKSLVETIRKASLCLLPSGKRHCHQRRIPSSSLVEANSILQAKSDDIQKCSSFAELHELIDKEINSVYRIGDLTVYDIAHRIGAKLQLEPEEIYLHAGTAVAAQYLSPEINTRTVSKSALPEQFHCLNYDEIEDCLCIFKDEIKKIVQHAPPAGRGEAPRP